MHDCHFVTTDNANSFADWPGPINYWPAFEISDVILYVLIKFEFTFFYIRHTYTIRPDKWLSARFVGNAVTKRIVLEIPPLTCMILLLK